MAERRYAENPNTQKNLAEWHEGLGRDGYNCYKRECRVCGKVFYAGKPHANVCSERCKQDSLLADRRAVRAQNHDRQCAFCGERFSAKRSHSMYCSGACRQAMHRRRQKKSDQG